jgi:hypothetical protein
MTALQYLKNFLKDLPQLSQETDYSVPHLALSFAMCRIFYGANTEEFRALKLYDCSPRKRRHYLLYRDCVKYSDKLNAGATKDELAVFDDKSLFNKTFSDFIHRDWLYMPDSTPAQLRDFLARNETFLAKATISTQGKGITLYHSADLDADTFWAEYQDKPYLLETFIVQHPSQAALNPSTVNTVRIQTARKGDTVLLLGACLRCGGADAFVDNFHQGGIAYPIDMDTGLISGRGRTLLGQVIYLRHPSTGHIMPGYQVPHWDELRSQVRKAALVSPHVGYVGWDIAITADGVEFVEGNINYPDPIVVQLDDNCIRSKVRDLVK